MLGPQAFRELVSGRRRGIGATLARAAVSALEVPYSAAVRLRNWRYDTCRAEVHRVGVPVVSVGNLTLGGTGKTPCVELLARWFLDRGARVGLVSRGYGAKAGQPNDEALELAQKLPQVPHVLDRDRVRGARRAIDDFGCRLILLDDGFQHRRLHRDLNLVLIDALEPFGFGHVFPRGTLREPLSGWRRADAFVLTRSETIDAQQRMAIRQEALFFAPHAIWSEATHAPHALLAPNGESLRLETLAGRRVAAFCAIGNPAGFRRSLASRGYEVAAMRELADHHPFDDATLASLVDWTDKQDIAAVICTCKDLVKINTRWTGQKPLFALSAQMRVTSGWDALEGALAQTIAAARLPGKAVA